jgi:hypothetical protein
MPPRFASSFKSNFAVSARRGARRPPLGIEGKP